MVYRYLPWWPVLVTVGSLYLTLCRCESQLTLAVFLLLGWGGLITQPLALTYGKRGMYLFSQAGSIASPSDPFFATRCGANHDTGGLYLDGLHKFRRLLVSRVCRYSRTLAGLTLIG